MPSLEAAARFPHKLVWIHPFRNGNGRHARQLTDLLALSSGRAPFSWGRSDLGRSGNVRDSYIAALRTADGGDIRRLLEFIDS